MSGIVVALVVTEEMELIRRLDLYTVSRLELQLILVIDFSIFMLINIMKVLLRTLIFVFDLDLERGLAAVLLVIVMKWDFPL